MSGTRPEAGVKDFGGSKAVKKRSWQVLNVGLSSLICLGNAIRGRYGSPGVGLY